ncbi:MAG: fibronectin type III domain-containing protein [Chloroflexi bacterium]|nr:fibronectin type III domain-containing protein [Chloroflexota bacterium]
MIRRPLRRPIDRIVRTTLALLALAIIALAGVVPSARADGPAAVGIRVTDVSDQSVTISWRTYVAVTGTLRYGSCVGGAPTTVALDSRDTSQPTVSSTIHYVRIGGLQEKTTYCFDIVSGGTTYDNGGQHYTARTGAMPSLYPPISLVVFVNNPNGSPVVDAIAYVTLVDGDNRGASGTSATLSCYIQHTPGGDGCIVTLTNARTSDLESQFSYDSGDRVRVDVMSTDGAAGPKEYPAPTQTGPLPSPVTLGRSIYRQLLPVLTEEYTGAVAGW